MKKVFKKIIQFYLKILSVIVLKKHKPEIIVIAGSANKHTIKQELKNILSDKFSVRIGPKHYNAEIGVPLTILGLVSDSSEIKIWLPLIFKATKIALFSKTFPKKIILELGISHPNDMDYFLLILNPKIVILTDITPKYLDNFGTLDNEAREFAKLVKKTDNNGLVLLNYDDLRIKNLKKFTEAKALYYGKGKGSDFRALDITTENNKQIFNLKYNEQCKKIILNKFGVHYIYSKLVGEAIKKYYNI
ncbi:MAG: Mur ligase family protein [Patescibacteria group bacterium]|nr:Mur ligase family protein [Patescibacteria group bacterium]